MTAQDQPGEQQRCLQHGGDAYLSKPFTPEILLQTVQQFLPQCFEAGDLPDSDPAAPSDMAPEPAHSLDDYFDDLRSAVEQGNLDDLERVAGALKYESTQAGRQEIADHAMRVQLAARSHDAEQVELAIERLEAVLGTAEPTCSPLAPQPVDATTESTETISQVSGVQST